MTDVSKFLNKLRKEFEGSGIESVDVSICISPWWNGDVTHIELNKDSPHKLNFTMKLKSGDEDA